MSGRFFASGRMTWSALGAGAYAWDGDWRRSTYWAAATVLTAAVTF